MEIQSQSIAAMTASVQGNSTAAVKTSGASSSVQASSAATVAAPSIDRKQLEEAIRSMDEAINVTQPPQLAFSIDEDTERTVVRVTDANTGDLIRQIPTEEALAISKSLDKLQGLLIKQQA
jgi:flagellar protein FlaG